MHKNIFCCLLGLDLIYLGLLDCYVFICEMFGHPNYSRHNA
jgi:hypothetical protein